MDIKEMIAKLTENVKADPETMELFKKDPIKAVEKILGVDLPDETVEKIIAGVKAKIGAKGVNGILNKIKDILK